MAILPLSVRTDVRGLLVVSSESDISLELDHVAVEGADRQRVLEADPTLGFAYGRMRFFGDWEGELRFPPYDPYRLLYRHTIGLTALARRELFAASNRRRPLFSPARAT